LLELARDGARRVTHAWTCGHSQAAPSARLFLLSTKDAEKDQMRKGKLDDTRRWRAGRRDEMDYVSWDRQRTHKHRLDYVVGYLTGGTLTASSRGGEIEASVEKHLLTSRAAGVEQMLWINRIRTSLKSFPAMRATGSVSREGLSSSSFMRSRG